MFPIERCPSCGANQRELFMSPQPLDLFECGGCGLVYSDPQPREEVEQKYLSEYDLAEYFAGREARKSILYEQRLMSLPAPLVGQNRLCDVGCGNGQFLELAGSLGWDCSGVEMNPPAARMASARGATVFEGSFEHLETLPVGAFDLVTSWDSLEHTPFPRQFAQRLVNITRPGGLIAVTTLNRRALVARLMQDRWSMIGEDHFTYWDRRSIFWLFEELGMEVVRFGTLGLGRDLVAWVDRLVKRGRPSPLGNVKAADEAESKRSWDSARLVVGLEHVVNRGLDALDAGVGLELLLRKPKTQ